jgi:hypothetical protein
MSTANRPAGSEPYIIAMANQADRANRPTKFIFVASLLILAGLMYMLFGVRSFIDGSAHLRRQYTEQANAERQLAEIDRLNNRNPDLVRLYPPGELLMPNHLREAARTAFADNTETDTRPTDFTAGDVRTERLESSPNLNRNLVRVSLSRTGQFSLEDIFLFIETALRDDPSNMMFLSELDMRPTPRGWSVTSLEFRRYSFRRR